MLLGLIKSNMHKKTKNKNHYCLLYSFAGVQTKVSMIFVARQLIFVVIVVVVVIVFFKRIAKSI
jgi:hypothetical protein